MNALKTTAVLAVLAASMLAFGSGCLGEDPCDGDESCEAGEGDVGPP